MLKSFGRRAEKQRRAGRKYMAKHDAARIIGVLGHRETPDRHVSRGQVVPLHHIKQPQTKQYWQDLRSVTNPLAQFPGACIDLPAFRRGVALVAEIPQMAPGGCRQTYHEGGLGASPALYWDGRSRSPPLLG